MTRRVGDESPSISFIEYMAMEPFSSPAIIEALVPAGEAPANAEAAGPIACFVIHAREIGWARGPRTSRAAPVMG